MSFVDRDIHQGECGDENRRLWRGLYPHIEPPPLEIDPPRSEIQAPLGRSRAVDLTPFVEGTYKPPQPSVGAVRDDGLPLLYPGRWHSCIGTTGCGKSWFGLWLARFELLKGNTVVYLHFEESGPAGAAGTVQRLKAFGGLLPEQIVNNFRFLDCDERWTAQQFKAEIEALERTPTLLILDGVNAACSRHGWPVDKPEGVGEYRGTFVRGPASAGTAVLSLGHPVKARDRQAERHSYGSTAWLDEVDGVAFRMEPSKSPIGKGKSGFSNLYSVKDRYGSVEERGLLDEQREGWKLLGHFRIDSSKSLLGDAVTYGLSVPKEHSADDALATVALRHLASLQGDQATATDLKAIMGSARNEKKVAALASLQAQGFVQVVRQGNATRYEITDTGMIEAGREVDE